MNRHLKNILSNIQQDKNLSEADKSAIIQSLKDTDQEFEAQNRELEIESSLERVRAVAMSMMKADDLLKICEVQFNELKQLGFSELRNALIGIFHDDKNYFNDYDYSDFAGGNIHKIPYNMNSLVDRAVMRMKSANDAFTEFIVEGEELEEWKAFRKENGEYDDTRIEHAAVLYYYFYSINSGNIGISTFKKISEDQLTILKRFRNVFDLAYRRYVDISTAEAQAKEARIETALERVRAVAMAMREPADMLDICKVICTEMDSMNVKDIRNVQTAIFKKEKGTYIDYEYYRLHDKTFITEVDYTKDEISIQFAEGMMGGSTELFTRFLKGKEVKDWYEFQKTTNVFPDKYLETATSLNYYWFSLGPVALGISTYKLLNEEDINLFKRFRNVFDLSYRRFLDIEKALAQARESQIELALERVRARTMAMQKSDELLETSLELFQQLKELGEPAEQLTIGVIKEEGNYVEVFATVHGMKLLQTYRHNINERFVMYKMVNAWKAKEKTLVIEQDWQELIEYNKYRNKLVQSDMFPVNLQPGNRRFLYVAFYSKGTVALSSNEPRSKETLELLERFAKVFDQTYTRFLDLKNAEAQTIESQIQLALERVRARTMAMQHSNELPDAANLLFQQIQSLGMPAWSAGYCTWNEDKSAVTAWMSSEGVLQPPFTAPTTEDALFIEMRKGHEEGKSLHIVEMGGDELVKHYQYMRTLPVMDKVLDSIIDAGYPLPSFQIMHKAYFSKGFLLFITYEPVPEAHEIFKRFASVFDQTYTRFLDLKKAEAQARESQIEAALERVRSRTLAMQRSDELAETAAVLFRQLILLGIQPNRLYIAIVKDNDGKAEFWITDEDGTKVSSAFETNLNDNPTFKKMFDGWKQEKRTLIIDMQGDELQHYFKYLTSINVPFKGGLTQMRRLQDIAYFSKGFIGMASPEELPVETLQLLERFAAVFNLTYTRFNDLQISEAHAIQAEQDLIAIKEAKQKAEDALTELQSAQKQLIQSEKMASLGELTAGIAHEIQNPLNFVNNFSEVSVELIKEMIDEVEKGNNDEVKAIADDLIQNLEKINHHGKRADGIVKGMLQHSRTTGSSKEPTDINKLADEYLRLAYHGLRAKDKSFNATLKTDFDESIGKINIIPQDIGRVILNLITNAFYAVNTPQPPKGGVADVPTVSVSTKKVNGKVEVKVSDNGTGIPKNIVDKIFQPFFTTKPTGQGTGLGLSLAYDIVKAHGGELKVETKENEGTTFIIQLPVV
ncbi:MAG: ATP-binding protein [Ferruginibacter sp.]